jgi:hypothetical protein
MLTKAQQFAFDAILIERGGRITDAELLDSVHALGESCPLYNIVFNCPDGEAARRYRLAQCAWIIRHARFEFRAPENPVAVETRRVVNVESREGSFYLATERALRKVEYREAMMAEARAELLEWRSKWGAILGDDTVRKIES